MAKKAQVKTTKTSSAVASKKTTPKKVVKAKVKTNTAAAVVSTVKTSVQEKSLKQKTKAKKLYILFALGIIALGLFLYFGRGLFVAAVVNGQPISRLSVLKEAEKQSGHQVLLNMVTNTLIEQEARKAKVSVSNDELNKQLKEFEESFSKQGRNLDEELAAEGLTRESVKKPLRLQILVEKMVGKDIKVTDEEVAKYIEENKDFLPQNEDEAAMKKSVAESLKQQKLSAKVNDWLSALQSKAKILYFVQY